MATLAVPQGPERPESTTSTLRGEDNIQEKKQEEEVASEGEGATVAGEDVDEAEYPTGIKMFFIVLALVLSVFLFSLDLVSHPLTHLYKPFQKLTNPRLSSQPPFLRSQRSSKVLTKPAGMVLLSS